LGPLNIGVWLDAVKRGRTFCYQWALLGFSLGGKQVGDELRLPAGEEQSEDQCLDAIVRSYRSSAGDLQRTGGAGLKIKSDGETADVDDTIPISRSGWCLLRA
jgi:hypothetical protein